MAVPEPPNATRRRRVLFVDDEREILDALQDMLRPERRIWQLAFVDSGPAALAEMAKQPFDVVVSDMRMPMSGADLLMQVKELYPATARIVLSGHAEREAILRVVPAAQQFLSKPCDPAALRSAIHRTDDLNRLLQNESVRSLIGKLDSLPSAPAVYLKLSQRLADPSSSIADLAAVIETDPAMSTKILQLTNSAFFASSAGQVSSIERAVSYLGVEIVRSLALSAHAFKMVKSVSCEVIESLQRRALWTATTCRRLVGKGRAGDEAFTAGLLHDIGLLLLAEILPDQSRELCARALRERRPLEALEREELGVTHAELGAYLLGLWGLPFPVVEAAGFHHAPQLVVGGQRQLLAALHVAGAMLDSLDQPEGAVTLDHAFLATCELGARLPGWLTLAAGELTQFRANGTCQ